MAKPDDVDRMLDDLLKDKKPETILGREGLLKQLTKRLVERALESELTDHLGHEKHAIEGGNGENPPNGRTSKRVVTDNGEVEVEIPPGSG